MNRLLLVSEARAVGGAEVYLERLAAGLDDWRTVLAVPASGAMAAWRKRLETAGLQCVAYDSGASGMRQLRDLARNADLVHVNLPSTYDGGSGTLPWRLSRSGRPVVVTEHLTLLPRSRRRRLWKRLTDRAVAVRICVSRASADGLRAEGFTRVQVIPNGVPDPGAPLPLPDGEKLRVGVAGSLETRKGIDTLIEAVARVGDSRLRLEIAGDGPLRETLPALVRARGVEEQVSFAGQVDDIYGFFAAQDVAALSSRLEAMPLCVLEAMAAGRGSLVTALPGMNEIVTVNSTGRLLPVDDPGAWADCLAELIRDRTLVRSWGAEARRDYEARFTLAHSVRETEKLYREVIGE